MRSGDTPMTSDAWYSLQDLPPGRVHVRVSWSGRQFAAAYAPHPKTKRWAWCVLEDGEIKTLPPKRDRTWSPEPTSWQPLDPSKWIWPHGVEPDSVMTIEPRIADVPRGGFQSVDDAENAERDQVTAQPRRGARRALWWLDAGAITYAPAGDITLKDAEGRVMRALASDWVAHFSDGLGLHETDTLARIEEQALRRLADIELHNPPEQAVRFQPGPQDETDYLTAMQWFAALGRMGSGYGANTLNQLILVLASSLSGLSFSELGLEIGTSRQAAHRRYKAAIAEVTDIANGAITTGVWERQQALAAVRAGNRQAKSTRMTSHD